jgi:phage terminase large subunit
LTAYWMRSFLNLMAITQTEAFENCINLAVKVGVEQGQLKRFLRAGYVPQSKQMEFHALARLADNSDGPDRIGYGGTRGQAKSHAILAQAIIDDMQRRRGLKGLYLRKIQKRARESFEDLRRKILAFTPHKAIQGLLRLPNGSFMVLGGFRTENEVDDYLGLEYDFAIIEDATVLSKTKYDAIRGSVRSSRDDWRPRIYAPANPGGVGHGWYVNEFLKDASGTAFVQTKMGDNAFINPEYETYLNGLTGFLRKAWRDGNFSISAGQFFTTFSEDIHVIKPFSIPHDWAIIGCLDYGWVHPTAVYVIALSGDGILYIIAEHVASRLPVETHAQAIKQMLADMPGGPLQLQRLRSFIAGGDVFAESRKDGGTIAQDYRREGITLVPGNTARIQGAQEWMRRLGSQELGIEPTVFIFEGCHRLIECMPELQHDPKRMEDVLKVDADTNGDGGDDPYDATRYGLMEFAKPRGWVRGR